jgi:aspartyl/asparaginyl beta-hydroxylase (cupin superfamily)
MASGLASRPPAAPYQRAEFIVPGLTARPWHDAADLPITTMLTRHWREIRAELDAALAARSGFQHYVTVDDADDVVPREWKALYLRQGTMRFPGNRSQCPRVTAIINADARVGELVAYSALDPGGHIKPHGGIWNCRLNVHLGLVVPDGCGLRVGAETRTWSEGECLVFDDSFEHEAWNRGDRTRFVLLLSVWHPELTDVEIEFLAAASELVEREHLERYVSAVERGRGELSGGKWWT